MTRAHVMAQTVFVGDIGGSHAPYLRFVGLGVTRLAGPRGGSYSPIKRGRASDISYFREWQPEESSETDAGSDEGAGRRWFASPRRFWAVPAERIRDWSG